ncbi:MAG: ATP-binding cassette domain-containing protein [Planctomycetota bacterium]|nr:MAG: ATP-binding cassette domain-containing protein [Planctomycetota bacterium]
MEPVRCWLIGRRRIWKELPPNMQPPSNELPASPPALEVRNLVKAYGDRPALQGLDFQVRAGEVFGLLGPNGAGKSTTIACIAGWLTPDRGQIRLHGLDLFKQGAQARRRLGVVPQELALYEEISALDNLRF